MVTLAHLPSALSKTHTFTLTLVLTLSLTDTHLHTGTDTHTQSPAYTHTDTTLISPWWFPFLPRGQVSNLDLDLTESVFWGESGPLRSGWEADF